jgi:hypothetical protein
MVDCVGNDNVISSVIFGTCHGMTFCRDQYLLKVGN